MPPIEPWSPGAGTAPWDYSGSGAPGEPALEPELCAARELPYGHAYVPALYLAAFALGLPGNALVLWLLAGRRGPRRPVDTFVRHLAAADLGFVLTLPLWAAAAARGGRWPFGEGLCKLSSFALAGTRCAGALLLAGLSLDRCRAVGRPLAARARRAPCRASAACAGVWAAALAAGLPALAFRRLRPLPGARGSQCAEAPSAAAQGLGLLLLLLTLALPLAATVVCYCQVWRRLRGPPRLGRARSRSLRIIVAVEGAFVGSWLPFCALRAVFHLASLRALPLACRLLQALRWGLSAATCLAFVGSCANPLIYLLLDRSFRAQLRRRGACGREDRAARGGSSASSLSGDDGSPFRRSARGGTRAPATPAFPAVAP
ncbi:probable G-protein coupled receptor 25 [Hippopotamus amphibius kiboko]|uniref:probable G-protein coupled receptor 25 n=1 Tax=Hippopotamus amphibius kiboko TaxID=575201 RepID=UPI0025989347|nr:probable G-protein coupled receptor 25 [Hippopotamus amphibius kiboko]